MTLLIYSSLLLSCAHKSTAERGPASVQEAPLLWGKPVNNAHQDLLEDIENAPAGVYKGQN